MSQYSLPLEIWINIFEYLSLSDILVSARVCKEWAWPLTKNTTWEKLLRRHFKVPPKGEEHRIEFAQRYITETNWNKARYTTKSLKLSQSSINVIEYNAEGTRAIAGGDDGNLHLVDISGPELTSEVFLGSNSIIWVGHFLNEDKHVISSGHDCKIKIWDVATKSLVREIPNNHARGIWEIIYKDGKIYTTGNDGMARVIDFETGQEELAWKVSHSFVWNLLPIWSRNLLVASSQDSVVHFLDYRVGRNQGRMKAEEQLTQLSYQPVAWPDLLAGGDSQGVVTFWDIRELSYTPSEKSIPYTFPVLTSVMSHPFNVRDIAFDGTKLLVATKDKKIKSFDMQGLMSGKYYTECLKCTIADVEAFTLEMSPTDLLVGTRVGEFVKYDFAKSTGFLEGLMMDGLNTVGDKGCSVM